jgi:uncharacterized protein (TIGR01777 family)
MNIAITGGTGFVGSALTDHLVKDSHNIFILTRHPKGKPEKQNVTYVEWRGKNSQPEKELKDLDAIVNLAGESINSGRWTEERRKRILESRIEATQEVIRIIEHLEKKPEVLVNASAIGYYGMSETETFTEKSAVKADDFLAGVVRRWEKGASKAEEHGVRTVFTRFGIILGQKGALPRMVLPYKLFAGGSVGSGEQWLSWVHIDDVAGMIQFAIENEQIHGALNVTAPHPQKMKDFGKEIGHVLNRPHWIPAPGFALKIALGEMSSLVLYGQLVLPEKAEKNGYSFHYQDLHPALENVLK